MTSNHLFFNAMKEDLRHKTWLIAVSALGNFLLIMVAWLILRSNQLKMYGGVKELLLHDKGSIQAVLDWIVEFFDSYLVIAGGLFCIMGAFLAGMFSFRYLFHKNMVDTYHALPVKRHTLYSVCYLNGILVWIVPFSVFLLPVLFMACGMTVQLGRSDLVSVILANTGLSFLTLVIVYLLVYHLVLTAVMLCGNVLNTLVSAMLLGFGVIALFGLIVVFFDAYQGTFYSPGWDAMWAVYASPLFSAFYLIFRRSEEAVVLRELWKDILASLPGAAVLGAAAWLLYRGRASETAEQGIRKTAVATAFRMIAGTAAGMCGWAFFGLLTADFEAVGWGIFGGVLGAVLVSGVLDILFRMDFRAFFSHKMQMAVTVVLSLLICFLFYRDWFGYDTYLPDQEDIAEIAVYCAELSNMRYYDDLDHMHFRDREKIYAFLEAMTEHEREGTPYEYNRIVAKITLENGRSYFRSYRMGKEDKELVWPMVTDEEYLKHAYLMDEREIVGTAGYRLETADHMYYGEKNLDEITEQVVRAYRRDVLENTDSVLMGQGRLLAMLEFEFLYLDDNGDTRRNECLINVYEGMEHTAAALEESGVRIPDVDVSEVEAIVLKLDTDAAGLADGDRVRLAGEKYGMYEEGLTQQMEEESGEVMWDLPAEILDGAEAAPGSMRIVPKYQESAGAGGSNTGNTVRITDRKEIEEVFGLLSFAVSYSSANVFGREYTDVDVVMSGEDGAARTWYIPKGVLPEKYILKFGEP